MMAEDDTGEMDGQPPHDPSWTYPYQDIADGTEEWPRDDDGAEVWVKYSLKKVMNELACVLHHLERGLEDEKEQISDPFNAAMHMGNIAEGVASITHTIFSEMLSDENRLAVTLHMAEVRLGIPLVAEKVEGQGGAAFFVIRPNMMDVPDTLDEMMKEGREDG